MDAPREGRAPVYSTAEQHRLQALVEEEPRQHKRAQAQLAVETGKAAGTKTLTRVLKKSPLGLEALPAIAKRAA